MNRGIIMTTKAEKITVETMKHKTNYCPSCGEPDPTLLFKLDSCEFFGFYVIEKNIVCCDKCLSETITGVIQAKFGSLIKVTLAS